MSISIREATGQDTPWLLTQLREFSRFFGTKHSLFPADDDVASSKILDLIENHYVRIADSESVGPMGFIAAYQMPHPFNPEVRMLAESFWFVSPECRRTRAGFMLLEDFISYGEANADLMVFSTLPGRTPIADDTLERWGFHEHERCFLREV